MSLCIFPTVPCRAHNRRFGRPPAHHGQDDVLGSDDASRLSHTALRTQLSVDSWVRSTADLPKALPIDLGLILDLKAPVSFAADTSKTLS